MSQEKTFSISSEKDIENMIKLIEKHGKRAVTIKKDDSAHIRSENHILSIKEK